MFNSCDLKQSLYISQFQHDNLMLEIIIIFKKFCLQYKYLYL